MERLQKILARAGVASRRACEQLMAEGRVTVNGATVRQLGTKADPAVDDIRVDGRAVKAPAGVVWLVLHKPAGVMTSRGDTRGRRTVFDLVDDVPGLTYVGRLDYMTEGVLLLTTDGKATHALMHPSHGVERTYVAIVQGDGFAAARQARRGVQPEDGPVHPAHVDARQLRDGRFEFEVTITEGRKREVRRLCKALGLRVERLIRTRYGPVSLGTLKPGESRPLTGKEIEAIGRIARETPGG